MLSYYLIWFLEIIKFQTMVNTTFEKFLLELSRRVYEDPKLQGLGNALGLREFEIGSIRYDKLSRDGKTIEPKVYFPKPGR